MHRDFVQRWIPPLVYNRDGICTPLANEVHIMRDSSGSLNAAVRSTIYYPWMEWGLQLFPWVAELIPEIHAFVIPRVEYSSEVSLNWYLKTIEKWCTIQQFVYLRGVSFREPMMPGLQDCTGFIHAMQVLNIPSLTVTSGYISVVFNIHGLFKKKNSLQM